MLRTVRGNPGVRAIGGQGQRNGQGAVRLQYGKYSRRYYRFYGADGQRQTDGEAQCPRYGAAALHTGSSVTGRPHVLNFPLGRVSHQ